MRGAVGAPSLRCRVPLEGVPSDLVDTHLREMTATIPINTVGPALSVLSSADGEAFVPTATLDGTEIVLPLTEAIASQPWRLAILLNLIDFSGGEEDSDLRLIDRVVVESSGLDGVTVEQCFGDLQERFESARAFLSAKLPDGFYLDEYAEGAWPEEAEFYSFAVTMSLGSALSPDAISRMGELCKYLEQMNAWMGFTLDGNFENWMAQNKILYPGGVEVDKSTLVYRAERPPSDISLTLVLVEEMLLKRFETPIERWSFDIQPM